MSADLEGTKLAVIAGYERAHGVAVHRLQRTVGRKQLNMQTQRSLVGSGLAVSGADVVEDPHAALHGVHSGIASAAGLRKPATPAVREQDPYPGSSNRKSGSGVPSGRTES
jgi:hypothetical protein